MGPTYSPAVKAARTDQNALGAAIETWPVELHVLELRRCSLACLPSPGHGAGARQAQRRNCLLDVDGGGKIAQQVLSPDVQRGRGQLEMFRRSRRAAHAAARSPRCRNCR